MKSLLEPYTKKENCVMIPNRYIKNQAYEHHKNIEHLIKMSEEYDFTMQFISLRDGNRIADELPDIESFERTITLTASGSDNAQDRIFILAPESPDDKIEIGPVKIPLIMDTDSTWVKCMSIVEDEEDE